jgi:hypothetical protein
MKPFALVTALAIASATLLFQNLREVSAQNELADLIERAEKSVVRIDAKGRDGEWLGSGFVTEQNGVIFTNHHVMEGAVSAKAVFQDGRSYDVVGVKFLDATHDIAVIKIDAGNLPVLTIAEELPRKGENVVALGSPHGLSFTASQGIVSAIRSFEVAEGDDLPEGVMLQTTAPISSGNSGGPLINPQGIVVGMNTWGITVGQNLNFAVACVELQKANAVQGTASVIPLATSTANLGKPKKPKSDFKEAELKDESINRYVTEAKQLENGLKSDILRRHKLLAEQIAAARKAVVGDSIRLGKRNYLVDEHFGKTTVYCRTAIDKEKLIRVLTEEADELKSLASTVRKPDPQRVLFELARRAGPPLDVREIGDVGFIQDMTIVEFTTSNIIIAASLKRRSLMAIVGEPIDRYRIGDDLKPFVGYVSGVISVDFGNRTVDILTIRKVSDQRLANIVFAGGEIPSDLNLAPVGSGSSVGSNIPAATSPAQNASNANSSASKDDADLLGMFKADAKQPRVWSDQSGKFQIKAVYISQDAKQVILRRGDNQSLLTVPKDRLSQTDRDFLAGLE